jgi:hypothetical protein
MPDFYCTLVGSRAGVTLPGSPLVTAPGQNALILGANFVDDPTRARGVHECDFVLPTDWASGVLTLAASIHVQPSFGPPVSLDCCADNDSFTLTDIAFTPTRDLFFAPFALRVNNGVLGFPDDIFAEAKNLLPIGDGQFHMGGYVGEIDITDIWNQDVKACGFLGLDSCPEDRTGRAASASARLRDIADDLNFTESAELVVGIYPQVDLVSGQSDRIGGLTQAGCTGPFWDCDELQVMVVRNQTRRLTSVAHELGHMLGRVHASFACNAGDVDNNGPAEHWPPDEQGFLQAVGVDRRNFRVVFPDRTGGPFGGPFFDFMSYCANTDGNDPDSWISEKGWLETIGRVSTGRPGDEARTLGDEARRTASGKPVPVLVVQGFLDLHGNVSVTKIAEGLRRPSQPAPTSAFELVVFGRHNAVIARQKMDTVVGVGHNLPAKVVFLSATVPAQRVEAIEILRDGTPLARRERSSAVPVVQDVDVRVRGGYRYCPGKHHGPKSEYGAEGDEGAETAVTWRSRYAGKTALKAKVDFSADRGMTWRPVFFGPDKHRVVLDNQILTPASAARIRVRLSDGFNEVSAISPPFCEPGGSPSVKIVSPLPGAEVSSGQLIYLNGTAYDARHQLISGEQMVWYAGNKMLGTGTSVIAPSMPPGDTSIRLVVSDGPGHDVERAVPLHVKPR